MYGLSQRHKVFVSYYHYDDQLYRNEFERRFKDIMICKSVKPGDIDSDLSDEYIKRLIQNDYLSDSSVLIVLVGPNTKRRKHVDWEISAALMKKVGGYSGLIGILLPTFRLGVNNTYSVNDLPARLSDNVISGYAEIYTWGSIISSSSGVVSNIIDNAFKSRVSDSNKINNSRIQMKNDV